MRLFYHSRDPRPAERRWRMFLQSMGVRSITAKTPVQPLLWAWFRSSVYDLYNWECGVGTPRAGSCRVQAARGRAPSASFVKMASPQSEPCPSLKSRVLCRTALCVLSDGLFLGRIGVDCLQKLSAMLPKSALTKEGMHGRKQSNHTRDSDLHLWNAFCCPRR
jgi:hypothetical protein